jgi:hypothetical protein
VLPCAIDEFEARSVAPAGERWMSRFRACLDAASPVSQVTSDSYLEGRLLYRYCTEVAMGLALLRARYLDAPVFLHLGRNFRSGIGRHRCRRGNLEANWPRIRRRFSDLSRRSLRRGHHLGWSWLGLAIWSRRHRQVEGAGSACPGHSGMVFAALAATSGCRWPGTPGEGVRGPSGGGVRHCRGGCAVGDGDVFVHGRGGVDASVGLGALGDGHGYCAPR